MLTYYVYRHVRMDTRQPFYIGVGTSRHRYPTQREFYGRAYTKTGRSAYWNNITKKTEYRVEILFESNDREEVLNKEREFIAIYGLKVDGGLLCNLTYGGESFVMSDELKQHISDCMIGNKNSKGTKRSDETRRLMGQRSMGNTIWRGRKHKEESKVKISKALMGRCGTTTGMRNINGRAKPILCNETKESFSSICECVRLKFKCTEVSTSSKFRAIKNSIIKVLRGRSKSYKGLTFKYQ